MPAAARLFVVLVGLSRALAAQNAEPRHAHTPELGSVTFPSSGATGAQEPFVRGIALLHSFEYIDAAAAFQKAQRADPRFALAYWGEALTHSAVLWGLDAPDSARRVLARLAPTPAARLGLAPAGRERSFGAAVEAFYAGTTLAVRAAAFADSMRLLAHRDTTDVEMSAFAAIAALMSAFAGPHPAGRDTVLRNEAIALGTRAFAANPRHPGAAHYLIHAYDNPTVAVRGLPFARAYAGIAPDAAHAQHMPSHIFVQIGAWDDLVASDERAWAVSRDWVRRNRRAATELSFHSLGWLQYGYVQQGRFDAARALIDTARAVLAGIDLATAEVDARYAIAELRFMAAAASGDWSTTSGVVPPAVAPAGASLREEIFTTFARTQAGYAAALRGDTAIARRVSDEQRAILAALPAGAAGRGRLTLAGLHVDAALARRRGDRVREIALLEEAVRIEDRVAPLGPIWIVPAHEQLGAALVAAGRTAEALSVLRRGLELRPNRSELLLAIVRAERAAGMTSGSTARRLAANWRRADRAVTRRISDRAGSTP